MNRPLVDFKTAFVDFVDSAEDVGPHPDPGELRRFQAGELPETEAERLREHLLGCRECMAYLRSPESFAVTDPKTDFEIAAFWRGLRPDLKPSRVRQGSRQRGVYALAAGLAAGVLGLGTWSAMQSRTIATLSAPRPNVPIHDLSAADARGGPVRHPASLVAGVGGVLVLTPTAVPEQTEYGLRILGPGEAAIHTVHGLVPDPHDQTFSLDVMPGFLEPGAYTVELYGNGPGGKTALGTFHLSVTARAAHR